MSILEKHSWLDQQKNQFSKLGLKENIFLLMVFNWVGFSLCFFSLLSSAKSRNLSYIFIIICLVVIGFSTATITQDFNSATSKFFIITFLVILMMSVDFYQNRFMYNAIIHLINSGYLGIGFYFFIMQLYPENFPVVWQRAISSAPRAFDMLILCLLFQNIGYYIVWGLFYPIEKSIKLWSSSYENLVNLSFIKHPYQRLFLFVTLSSLGLISRLWNLSLGRIYYTERSSVPFYISSFLSQFDNLYFVAWLYGYGILLQSGFKKNTLSYITFALIPFEFLFQLFSGSKGRFFSFVIVPMASTYILVRQKIPWIAMILISSLGIVSWLFIYPILTIYRNLLSSAIVGIAINPIEVLNQSIQILIYYSWDKYLETILTPLNSSGIAEQVTAMTSIIHNQLSQEGTLLWQRLFLFWIPRFLWADKPETLSANLIGRLSGRLSSEDFTTSVLITGPGELFLYYGLWGSLLMILTGLLFRWLNEAISPFKINTPFRVAVLVTYLPLMQTLLSGSFESALTGIILQTGILYLILLVVKIQMPYR